jgi:hypothetical protein
LKNLQRAGSWTTIAVKRATTDPSMTGMSDRWLAPEREH